MSMLMFDAMRGRTVLQTVQVPGSIDATGTDDVSVEMQAFLDAQSRNTTIVFPTSGTYRCENTLRIVDKYNWVIEGNGSTIVADTDGSGVTPHASIQHQWPRQRSHLMFIGGSYEVTALNVRGPHPDGGIGDDAYVVELEAQHGYALQGCKRFRLNDVTITDIYGDGAYLGPRVTTINRDVIFDDVTIMRNGRQGVGITSVDGFEFVNGHISAIRRATFDIEPNFSYDICRNVRIHDSTFGAGRLLFFASKGAGGTIENITIEDNVLTGKAMIMEVQSPTGGPRRRGYIVRNNVSDTGHGGPSETCMWFVRVDDITVTGNTQPLQSGRNMHVARTDECCGTIDISGNTFPGGVGNWLTDNYACP